MTYKENYGSITPSPHTEAQMERQMGTRPLIDMPQGIEAYRQNLSVVDTMDRVNDLTSALCGLRLEADHVRVILNRLGAAISDSEGRNDDQTGWDVVGDLVDRAAIACDDIETFDVPAAAREAARDFRDEERREQRALEV